MSTTFGSNIAALRALCQIGRSGAALEQSFQRLSSGMRINQASDDAAGLAVSMGLGRDSRVYAQAMRNANDGISALQVAGESLGNANNILFRLKELATQGSNSTLSVSQRLSIDKESKALTEEYNRQMGSVDFNGLKLLNGTFGRMNIQVGYGGNGSIGFTVDSDLKRNVASDYQPTSEVITGAFTTPATQLADLNRDGKLDMVAVDTGNSTVNILLGNGDGTFGSPTSVSMTAAVGRPAIADLNGDGILDIATCRTTSIFVRFGTGTGAFGSETTLTAGAGATTTLAVGDVNGDGISDIVGGSTTNSTIRVLLGQGGGQFASAITFAGATNATNLTVSDLDGDGRGDIITRYAAAGGSLGVTMSAPGNTFSTSKAYSGLGNFSDLQIADINYDGKKDIVTLGSSVVNILLGNGDGTLNSATTLSAPPAMYSTLMVTDMDGDGITDIAYFGGGLSIHSGNGDGSFKSAVSYTNVTVFSNATFGDVNNDGVLDVLGDSDLLGATFVNLATTQTTTTMQRINLTSRYDSLLSLATIQTQMDRVSAALGAIGATQSRVSSALNTLAASRENCLAAQSRIQDTDVALESANLARRQILMQSASAVLGQANQQPMIALSLLKL